MCVPLHQALIAYSARLTGYLLHLPKMPPRHVIAITDPQGLFSEELDNMENSVLVRSVPSIRKASELHF